MSKPDLCGFLLGWSESCCIPISETELERTRTGFEAVLRERRREFESDMAESELLTGTEC